MLYGIEYWSTKKQSVNKMSVIETRMLRYICDKTRRERELEMKTFCKIVDVAPIEGKVERK